MDPVRVATQNAKQVREVSAIQSDIGKWTKDVTSLLYLTQAIKGAILMHIEIVCDAEYRPDGKTLQAMASGNQYVKFTDGKIVAKTDKDYYGDKSKTCEQVIEALLEELPDPEALKLHLDEVLVQYKNAKTKVSFYEKELDDAKNGNRNTLADILTEVWCEDNGKNDQGKFDHNVSSHRMGSVTDWNAGANMIKHGTDAVLDEPKF